MYRSLHDLTKGLGANCKIKSGGIEGSIKIVGSLKSILAGAQQLLVLDKEIGGGPGADRFELIESTGCSVPELVELRGSTVLLLSSDSAVKTITHGSFWVYAVTLGDLLRYGAQHAFVDGAVWVELTGAHTGCTWGSI